MESKYWYLILTNGILKLLLFAFIIYQAINLNWLWVFFSMTMFLISLIPDLIRRFLSLNIPLLTDLFICLAFLFHIGNELLDGSAIINIYNKFTHFFSAAVVALLALVILYVLHEYELIHIKNKEKVLFDVIVITISFGVIWELMEWSTDALFSWRSQVDLDDTMLDLLADTLGGFFVAIIGYFLIKRQVIQTIAKDLKHQLDKTFQSE